MEETAERLYAPLSGVIAAVGCHRAPAVTIAVLATMLSTFVGTAAATSVAGSAVLLQAGGDFCDTGAGQLMSSSIGIIMGITVVLLLAGILVGMALEALPLTGRIAAIAHRIVGGVFVALFFGVIALSFLQFALGFSVIDPSMACTPVTN
ncbi:hypothetical protein [Halegenticoccus tardaugens]|uniref:hypothetical protein n=1 Tax=Halegenticoccus tardaugens TaxID=2071624 RepID=UPI00100A9703|nr:hypothetical protein [Halegenticoccus tardaugens]